MKEIAIICNLTAGSGQAEKRWEKFQMELGSASIDYTVHFTEASNHATDLTKNVINNGAKRIVSFGGDGTLNEVIQGMISTSPGFRGDLELVVLGAGSSNDFEKTFEKIPWIEKIQGDKIIPIDLVRLDYINFNGESATRFFVNNSSIGVISQAGDRFNNVSGLTKAMKRVSVDVESRMKLLGLIPSLYNGNALDKEGTRYFECEWLELQTNHDVVIETDGEIVGHPPARYTIMKHAIRTVIG